LAGVAYGHQKMIISKNIFLMRLLHLIHENGMCPEIQIVWQGSLMDTKKMII